jgi:hypothetical protein
MAKVTNAFSTYQAKGNREDLADAIYNIDPADRPFMSIIGKRNATNIQFDWQTENLPALDRSNKRVEGFELSRSAGTPTVRKSNICQISSRDATVTGSQNAANAAGKRSEMSHQMALAGKALMRDVEAILCSEQPRNNGEDDDTPVERMTRGAEHWITSNAFYGAGTPTSGTAGANPTSETAPVTDADAGRDFSELLLADAIQQTYEKGGEPTVLLMGPYQKRVFSTFKGRADSERAVPVNEVIAAVDIYKSDFGNMKALPSRWVRTKTVLGIDPEYFKHATYRRLERSPIAKVGDAETEMLVTEYGLECSNEAAHFKIADLTTTGNAGLLAAMNARPATLVQVVDPTA